MLRAGGGVLSVDDGPGIPPEHVENVFERFYRGGRLSSGSGLGLAIARELARVIAGRWTSSPFLGGPCSRCGLLSSPASAFRPTRSADISWENGCRLGHTRG